MSSADSPQTLTSWHECQECGFQGTFQFASDPDEDYEDPDALGYMMQTRCPSCDYAESLLIGVDHYREMVMISAQAARDDLE